MKHEAEQHSASIDPNPFLGVWAQLERGRSRQTQGDQTGDHTNGKFVSTTSMVSFSSAGPGRLAPQARGAGVGRLDPIAKEALRFACFQVEAVEWERKLREACPKRFQWMDLFNLNHPNGKSEEALANF